MKKKINGVLFIDDHESDDFPGFTRQGSDYILKQRNKIHGAK